MHIATSSSVLMFLDLEGKGNRVRERRVTNRIVIKTQEKKEAINATPTGQIHFSVTISH